MDRRTPNSHLPQSACGRVACTLVALSLAGCGGDSGEDGPSAPEASGGGASDAWFVEVAAESGLDFVHLRGDEVRYWLPEITGGSVGFLDYDGDGWLDVYCVQCGHLVPPGGGTEGNKLYRNQGDGTFVDVTEEAGVGDRGYGGSLATGDYDGDGDTDLFVSNLGPNVLYRNDGGGKFTDVTALAGVAGRGWGVGSIFTDVDSDGDLDLFVTNYLNWSEAIENGCTQATGEPSYCLPAGYHSPSRDLLFRNEGDGTFTDVSEASGITAASGLGLGVASADFNGDGHKDFYVANDGMPNHLWLNDGKGRFKEDALLSGCAVNGMGKAEAGMGLQIVDIENDGDWDLFLSHISNETNTFYRNERGGFSDRTATSGLAAPSVATTSFGLGFHDFDHDGNLDLLLANGRVVLFQPILREDEPYSEPNHVYRGLEGGRFELVGTPTKERLLGVSRGLGFGDYDNDGDVDAIYQDISEPLRLLRNEVGAQGSWLNVRVLNEHGSDALGADVVCHVGDERQYRQVQTSYGYASSNDPRVHFGLGEAQVADDVVVLWPDGTRESYGRLAANTFHVLRHGAGR